MPAEAGGPEGRDDAFDELDPVVADLFRAMAAAGRPALSAGTPGDARALTASSRAGLGAGPEMARVSELTVATRGGAVAVRLLVPHGPVRGLVVYAHGGGWVLGELDDFDAAARALAARSNCAVLMADYRLAPEHPFPAGLEDVEDVVRWAATRVVDLTGGAVPLVVVGDSAGANLVAATTNALAGDVSIAGQVLVYPVVDIDTTTPSYERYGVGMQLTRADMLWMFSLYAPPTLLADPRIAVGRATPRPDLPPTVVVTAQCDLLRDEGEAYARALAEAGVAVTARRFDGLPHGFIRMGNVVPRADEAVTAIAADVARLCAGASGASGAAGSS